MISYKMRPIKCDILLSKSSKMYFPSEIVQGSVYICTKTATNISKIELSLIGEGKFGTDAKFPVYNDTKCIEINKILPSGSEHYAIAWTLPWGLVPSFRWRSGCVNYHFVAKVVAKKRSGVGWYWGSGGDQVVVSSAPIPIDVQTLMDLSILPYQFTNADAQFANIPYRDSEMVLNIFLRFVLNRRCFVPGERLKFNCSVKTHSDTGNTDEDNDRKLQKKVFREMIVDLDEEISYSKPVQIMTCIVANVTRKLGSAGVVGRFGLDSSTSVWEDEIRIPDFCNSTCMESDSSGIVRVCYFLNVYISLPLSSSNRSNEQPQFRIPIVIGGIYAADTDRPLRSDLQMALLTSKMLIPWDQEDPGGQSDSHDDGSMPLLCCQNRPETPPPSYSTAVGMMMESDSDRRDSPPEYTP